MRKKRGLLFRVMKWGGLAILLAAMILVLVVLPYRVADRATSVGTRPMDLALTSTPADEGLDFEDVSFTTSDGVVLRGWYVGGGDRGASLVCAHGLFRSRREVLDRGVWFREMGYNVLLMDSRRHGESGGERATMGFKERLDVEAGIDFMKEREPDDRVILFGVSMGAAASLLAAAERPEVEGVIADSSYLDLEQVVTAYLELLLRLPRFPLGDMLLFFMERLGGFRKEELNLAEAVRRIGNRPILFLGGGDDRQAPPDVQRKLYEQAESGLSELVILEGAGHGAAYRTQPDAYRKALVDFLTRVEVAAGASAAPTNPGS